MLLDIVDVACLEGYKLLLTFENGERRIADLEERLRVKTGGIAEHVRERSFFSQVRVNRETGTIQWPNGADICPELLYSISVPIGEQKAG